ncbi:MAG: serine/threonine-protein kinase, partial [Akkermansiaceae bacterium]|nr:serine/threonine-protein kinase [Akkermansiaceae bacterium]
PTAIEVAQGLKAAKAAGLIHRDVKPGNILLDGDGHAKLVDFGLSLVTQGGTATAEELWATPFYVPPETVEGKAEDFRSDIYALGATLYHALAGVPPCNEDSMATDRLLKAKQEIVPLKQVAPEVSDETCEIVTQAMAYSPSERFSSYDDMIHALRRAEKQLRRSKHQKQLEMTQGHSLPRKKKPKPVWLGIAAAALLVIVLAIAATQLDKGAGDTANSNGTQSNNGNNAGPESSNQEAISKNFRNARNALRDGEYGKAAKIFSILHDNAQVQEPSRTIAGIEAILCHYLDGKGNMARKIADRTRNHIQAVEEEVTPVIGKSLPDLLEQLDSRSPLRAKPGNTASQSVIQGMLVGLKNWQQGLLDPAADGFRMAASANLGADDQWVAGYQSLASDFLADHSVLTGPLFRSLPVDLRRCERMIDELDELAKNLKTRGRARYNLRAWQLDLARQAKELRERQN